MKRDEAEQIFGIIAALYDLHPERAGQSAVAWVPALEELDAELTMEIVNTWMKGRGPEKIPTVPAFVRLVKDEAERRREPESRETQCEVCDDDGMVTVGRPLGSTEEVAPCPACSRGKAIEFPLEKVGPWGRDGFWRGRKFTKVGPGELEVAR